MLEPVAVYWLDAAGAPREPEIVPVPSVTFGLIAEITEEFIRVASENSQPTARDHAVNSDFTVIPAGMVLAIKRLPKVRGPLEVAEWMRVQREKKRKRGRAKGRGSSSPRA